MASGPVHARTRLNIRIRLLLYVITTAPVAVSSCFFFIFLVLFSFCFTGRRTGRPTCSRMYIYIYKLFLFLPSPPPPFGPLRFAVSPVRFLNRFLISSSRRSPHPPPPTLIPWRETVPVQWRVSRKTRYDTIRLDNSSVFSFQNRFLVRNERTKFNAKPSRFGVYAFFNSPDATGTCTAAYACTCVG